MSTDHRILAIFGVLVVTTAAQADTARQKRDKASIAMSEGFHDCAIVLDSCIEHYNRLSCDVRFVNKNQQAYADKKALALQLDPSISTSATKKPIGGSSKHGEKTPAEWFQTCDDAFTQALPKAQEAGAADQKRKDDEKKATAKANAEEAKWVAKLRGDRASLYKKMGVWPSETEKGETRDYAALVTAKRWTYVSTMSDDDLQRSCRTTYTFSGDHIASHKQAGHCP